MADWTLGDYAWDDLSFMAMRDKLTNLIPELDEFLMK